MRTFSCDPRYQRFLVAQLALVLAQVGRDKMRRVKGRPPTIPDSFLDEAATERQLIVVGTEREVAGVVPAVVKKRVFA